jgi:hypothetical protein
MAVISVDRALVVARAGARHLAGMVKPDGLFNYRYALNDPSFVNTIYGEVRHVGAVWAMADWMREGWDMPELAPALARAAGTMEQRLFRPYGSSGALCVWDEGLIKLSGSALGVAAEAALNRLRPSPDHFDRVSRLARHIASQREADGDFLPVRVPGPIPRAHPGRDHLTTGQAVMALALASEATGESAWLRLAADSADRLAARDYGVGALSHWMLYALEALDRVQPDDGRLAYAGKIAASIAAAASPDEGIPLACASEGLLAHARSLRVRGDREETVSALLTESEGLLSRQLRFFHPSGAFFMSAKRQEVRIDTQMHNVIGFLGYARLRQGRT